MSTERAAQFHDLYAALRIRDQLEFYRRRREEYAHAERQAIVVRNVLLVAAAASAVVGQFFGDGGRAAWGVVRAVLGALAAAVTAYSALIGFPQLRKLYSDAVQNLEEAEIDWSVVNPGALTDEVERVEGIFRSEIGQWGQLIVKTRPPGRQPSSRLNPVHPPNHPFPRPSAERIRAVPRAGVRRPVRAACSRSPTTPGFPYGRRPSNGSLPACRWRR